MASGSSQRPLAEPDEPAADNNISSNEEHSHAQSSAFSTERQQESISGSEERSSRTAKDTEAREAREAEERRPRRAPERLLVAQQQRQHSPAASSVISASSGRSIDTSMDDFDDINQSRNRLPSYDDAIAERPYLGPSVSYPSRRFYRTTDSSERVSGMEERRSYTYEPRATETQPLLFGENPVNNETRGGDEWVGAPERNPSNKRRGALGWLKKVLIFLLLTCVCVLVGKLIVLLAHAHHDPPPTGDPTGGPTQPPNELPGNARDFCKTWASSTGWSYDFRTINNIAFAQLGASRSLWGPFWGSGTGVRQGGEIHVVKASTSLDSQSSPGVSIRIAAYTSHVDLARYLTFESRIELTQGIVVYKTPRKYNGEYGKIDYPCMYSVVHVFVSPGANVSHLEIGSEIMSFRIDESLDMGPGSQELNVTLLAGNIELPTTPSGVSGLKSRNLRFETVSGFMNGTFPLYDSLTLSSETGFIDANIELKDLDPYAPKPAQLKASTVSGAMRLVEPAISETNRTFELTEDLSMTSSSHPLSQHKPYIPVRDYRSTVSSIAGRIDAQLIHGSKTSLESSSGVLNVRLAPYGDQSRRSEIKISSSTGAVDLNVSKAIPNASSRICNLVTKVRSTVSALNLNFPSTWEGQVEGVALSGSVTVDWPGFHRTERDDQSRFPFSQISGYVGKGNSSLSFSTISGAVTITGSNETTSSMLTGAKSVGARND